MRKGDDLAVWTKVFRLAQGGGGGLSILDPALPPVNFLLGPQKKVWSSSEALDAYLITYSVLPCHIQKAGMIYMIWA